MKNFLYNIKKYNRYSFRSASAELKSEVADSYLNWLWWILEPVCFMLIYTFIFSIVFKNNTPYFPAFVFLGLTPWDFFNRMIKGSVRLIPQNRDLVKKVYIPKYILLIAKSYTYLFKMGISLVISIILMVFLNVHITWYILFAPLIIIELYLLSFGIGLFLMHFGVTVKDLTNLVNIALRMVFYTCGVFYDITQRLSGAICFVMLKVNPIAFLMSELRNVMLYGIMPNFFWHGIWTTISLVMIVTGVKLINKNENSYAKVI